MLAKLTYIHIWNPRNYISMPRRTSLFCYVVGLMYLALGMWCAISPEKTSAVVGFELIGGAGMSEFLTVYGGLEIGMGMIFLLPFFGERFLEYTLLVCVLIHANLVFFRTLSFVFYSDIGSGTYKLAIGEWVIFLLGIILYRTTLKSSASKRNS